MGVALKSTVDATIQNAINLDTCDLVTALLESIIKFVQFNH